MSATVSSTEPDPLALQRLQEQTKILQANLDFYKLTVQSDQEKLKAEIDRVKLEADKQKAEADKIKALLPSGTTKPLSGETKTDEKFGYLAKLAVNEAVKVAAKEIAKQVRHGIGSTNPARIVLVDTLDFCGDNIQALQMPRQMDALKEAMADQATKIEKMLPAIKPEAPTGKEVLVAGAALPALSQVLAGVPGMISWAADIAAYFQVEDTYKSVDVAVPLTALQSSVADALKSDATTVCFPDFHAFGTLADLPILEKFRECSEARRTLSAQAAQLKLAIEMLTKAQNADSPPEDTTKLQVAEAAHATAQSLIQAFDDFSKLMIAVPEGKSYSPLARVAMRAYLKGDANESRTYLLYLNVVSSGGEVSIRKFLWYTHGIVFLGGCVVTYVLADLAGKTLASGTLGKLSQTKYGRGQKTPVQFEDLTKRPAAADAQEDQGAAGVFRIP